MKHCRIKQEGRLFIIGNATFETLESVISFYESKPLYRKMRLRYPATNDLIASLEQVRVVVGYHGKSRLLNKCFVCLVSFPILVQLTATL